ncbi:hypothetical protein IG631_15967 [Alternaria alternata]|nr:hypothetical protein IG631_15967 [Alternaria alternata]
MVAYSRKRSVQTDVIPQLAQQLRTSATDDDRVRIVECCPTKMSESLCAKCPNSSSTTTKNSAAHKHSDNGCQRVSLRKHNAS